MQVRVTLREEVHGIGWEEHGHWHADKRNHI
jgi:hypothetical protein